ncbi:hypothetical protein [Aliihoeflea sp. 40Bstr573]|uniref:hypothetical protein n=1 Tax=Aliihoeflea sp. 40Bstr573 TaxID=2696467 RepID=UPI002095EF17|nr:hypothetical protein [Aliihoeflea sp. 40Bstr573]MCO6386335.1 hypothetical protein [Aliihoeflea sp. 40Bstr573]
MKDDPRYPLALTWRRSWPGCDTHFNAIDPDRCGLSTVANIHLVTNHTPGVPDEWMWQCIAPGSDKGSVRPKMGAWRGYCPAPREAAWKAEEAYRRFLDVVPADVLASAVEAAEYWRQSRERIYAEKGMP